jgi:hypothetical protein
LDHAVFAEPAGHLQDTAGRLRHRQGHDSLLRVSAGRFESIRNTNLALRQPSRYVRQESHDKEDENVRINDFQKPC